MWEYPGGCKICRWITTDLRVAIIRYGTVFFALEGAKDRNVAGAVRYPAGWFATSVTRYRVRYSNESNFKNVLTWIRGTRNATLAPALPPARPTECTSDLQTVQYFVCLILKSLFIRLDCFLNTAVVKWLYVVEPRGCDNSRKLISHRDLLDAMRLGR